VVKKKVEKYMDRIQSFTTTFGNESAEKVTELIIAEAKRKNNPGLQEEIENSLPVRGIVKWSH
jgi:hypothetical protein